MKIFLLDLWNDLRAKRLWPVAVLLMAALVATPVVLSKGAEEPTVAPAPTTTVEAEEPQPEGPAALAQVKLEELAKGSGSSLSSFDDPSNPFAPPRKVLENAKKKSEGAGAPGSAAGVGAPTTGGSSGPAIGGDVNLNFGGGSGGSGGSVDVGGGTGGDTGGGTGGDTGETKTTAFTYVIDVTFAQNGSTRRVKGMEKLDILPDAAAPLLIFLGVSQNAGNAVFLVDSTLEAAGEGTCQPTGADCAFLYLGPGSEHEFTNENGDSFSLRVDEIRRVKLGDRKAGAASKKDRRKAGAAVGRPASVRRFVPPVLADLVTVSSVAGDDSNNDSERR